MCFDFISFHFIIIWSSVRLRRNNIKGFCNESICIFSPIDCDSFKIMAVHACRQLIPEPDSRHVLLFLSWGGCQQVNRGLANGWLMSLLLTSPRLGYSWWPILCQVSSRAHSGHQLASSCNFFPQTNQWTIKGLWKKNARDVSYVHHVPLLLFQLSGFFFLNFVNPERKRKKMETLNSQAHVSFPTFCAWRLISESRNQGKGMLEVPWLAVEPREWFASKRSTFQCLFRESWFNLKPIWNHSTGWLEVERRRLLMDQPTW